MTKHYIFMSSSYSLGKRIAIDFRNPDTQTIETAMKQIHDRCGNGVSISTHFITTDYYESKSVADYDSFFSNVYFVESLNEFIELILKDRELNGLDVAKYILSIVPCTHIKLQKLLYLCYADYLCTYNKPLFNDTIYAFKYGPVIDSVYEHYKGSILVISDEAEDDNNIDITQTKVMPSKSRILFSKYGTQKIASINATIEKYGSYDALELVNITHRPGSPWSYYDSNAFYPIIDDYHIKKYHCNEEKI